MSVVSSTTAESRIAELPDAYADPADAAWEASECKDLPLYEPRYRYLMEAGYRFGYHAGRRDARKDATPAPAPTPEDEAFAFPGDEDDAATARTAWGRFPLLMDGGSTR